MACHGPVPIITLEHLAGRTKSGRGPDPARGPRLARGWSIAINSIKCLETRDTNESLRLTGRVTAAR